MGVNYDFSGYATKNDLKCSDGRTIRKNAFKDNDGKRVPLVWQHMHDDPENVIGHALLENREDGVYAYGTFNDTPKGKTAKALVEHGDIVSLSIYANKLKQNGGDVLHGVIREVSLVLAGANPGASIDFPILAHSGEESETEATIYTGETIYLEHSKKDEDEEDDEEKKAAEDEESSEDEPPKKEEQGEEESDDEDSDDEDEEKKKKKKENEMAHADEKGKTVKDVFEELTDEQKNVVYFMIGQALEDAGVSGEEEDKEMKHNVFDQEYERQDVLSHDDMVDIIEMAKNSTVGTFKNAMEIYAEENDKVLMHSDVTRPVPVGGFIQTPAAEGDLTVEALFPDYKDIGQPWNNILTNDQGWIGAVMSKTHKSPISRIRTGQVDIRNIEALRAKGYQKGRYKKETGNFKLVRRTTDPQTIYVKNALHRDDIVDITDFDYVQYLYNIDKMMMNEEIATAIMFGDGRDEGDEDKIFPEHIRPIWLDDELYTRHFDLDMAAAREAIQGSETDSYFSENYIRAEAFIEKCLYTREEHKGTGTPDMFIHPHELNVMLLARDRNGRRIYDNVNDLKAAFNVANIYTCEQMINKVRTDDENKKHKLLALFVNLGDYQVGATKGGELTHFTQFDIDFNQQKSLLETRISGALTKVYSAIAIEEVVE